jgi:multiple sugar transport system permease protein
MLKKNTRETLIGYAFLSPALIIFLCLLIIPLVMSVYLAFTKWNFLSGFKGIKWIGLDNFTRLFTKDRSFKVVSEIHSSIR